MIKRASTVAVLGVAGLLAVAACGGGGGSSGGATGSTITFAAPVSQTGAFGQAEGLYTLQGYKFCVQTINDKGDITYGGRW